MPYMHCGCPLPGTTIGQRLSKLSSLLKSPTDAPSALRPPARPDALSATHPSEHNAVHAHGPHSALTAAVRARRAEKVAARRRCDEENVRKGKMDPSLLKRGEGHDRAFLVPIPMQYGVYPGCVVGLTMLGAGGGFVGGGFAACAVVSSLRSLY